MVCLVCQIQGVHAFCTYIHTTYIRTLQMFVKNSPHTRCMSSSAPCFFNSTFSIVVSLNQLQTDQKETKNASSFKEKEVLTFGIYSLKMNES